MHTPSSLVNSYEGDADDAWSAFLDDIEALPPEFSVIGINDYWFLDGYKRVLAARASGRLRNITTVFPVLELRLEQFGGTESKLRRVNLHVIFDPDLNPQVIEQQFISALSASFHLTPGVPDATWSGVVTRESLADLGAEIKRSVPPGRLPQYQSDLAEGFNNLNVPIERVKDVLKSSYLTSRYLLGVGKAEWAQIKWNDQSVASKKSIINSADFIFTAYQDSTKWAEDVETLRDSRVNHRILDCSDAHALSTSTKSERIGQCATWVNTTPTLAGLKHALSEYDRRIHVGLEPPILGRVRRHPEQFIDSLSIRADDPASNPVFNYDLALNNGFVAVVGNKGQGKSALLDCIALAGNSPRTNEFAFLTPQRFLSANNRNPAREYKSRLSWVTGASHQKALTDGHDRSAPVHVEYLPQKFVERVCSADAVSGEAEEFERELKDVLFTHIPEEERAGESSFDRLLARKTRASKDLLSQLQGDLHPLIDEYISLVDLRAAEDLRDLDARITLMNEEVARAEEALAANREALDKAEGGEDAGAGVRDIRVRAGELRETQRSLTSERAGLDRDSAADTQRRLDLDSILQRVEGLRRAVESLNGEADSVLVVAGDASVPRVPLVSLSVDWERVESWRSSVAQADADRQIRRRQLDNDLQAVVDQIAHADAELAAADSVSELARQRVLQTEERLTGLQGSPDDPGTQLGLQALRQRVAATPGEMQRVARQLAAKSKAIHDAYQAQLQEVRSLYQPASNFISNSEVVSNAGLEFQADLRPNHSFAAFASSLDGRRSPDFQEWLNQLPDQLDCQDWPAIADTLNQALRRLEQDRDHRFRHPASALRSNTSLEEYLTRLFDLSWLNVRFGLTGDGLSLSKLSPGQRGLVLVLFYLVVDRRATPLLLDQPEENLDNATIANLLVPALREAAGRRQTLVVTHNPNLAVVGDADQVIHCMWDGNTFRVEAGCISEVNVARFAVDILEGTKPAFNRRRDKYAAFPELG